MVVLEIQRDDEKAKKSQVFLNTKLVMYDANAKCLDVFNALRHGLERSDVECLIVEKLDMKFRTLFCRGLEFVDVDVLDDVWAKASKRIDRDHETLFGV